jgi:hypothetical protein
MIMKVSDREKRLAARMRAIDLADATKSRR